jgi:group I intron endonuclease
MFEGYLITNTVNGKMYVGKTTTTIKKRWRDHLSDARRCRLHSLLHRAIRKYGADKFVVQPLEPLEFNLDDEPSLNEWERLMIRLLGTQDRSRGYNLTAGGEGVSNPSHDVRERLRRAAYRRMQGAERDLGREAADLTGKTFGNWAVLRKSERRRTWVCRCECGTEKPVDIRNLFSGRSSSCGCKPRPMQANNKSGCVGVRWHKRARKYIAESYDQGKQKYLGLFIRLEDAANAVAAYRKRKAARQAT